MAADLASPAMNLVQVAILALVQALTEFLPISSSAHLVLVRWLLDWEDPGLFFDVALHFGTLLALTAYFAGAWVRILGSAVGLRMRQPTPNHPDRDLDGNPRLLWFLAAATVPAACAGMAFQDTIEAHLRSPAVIATMLIGVGCVIWWADRNARQDKSVGDLSLGSCLLIGCAQALALVPGTSRAGATIAVALLLGLERQAAARFSFLLAMPIVAGAALKTGLDTLGGASGQAVEYLPLGLGVLVSAVAGYGVITLFLRYLQHATMAPFVYYRWAFGILVLLLAGTDGELALLAEFIQGE